LNTGIAIPPNYWNLKRLRINPDLPAVMERRFTKHQLQRSIRLAEDILNFAIKKKVADPLSFRKNTFNPDLIYLTWKGT
jgi:hypothetical protein